MSKARGLGIGGHHAPVSQSDDWITPYWIIEAMGPLNLDPCESSQQPWPCAESGYRLSRGENGLALPWSGSVFVNPPYSRPIPWVKRLAEHGDGVLLTFARVETGWWQDWIWPVASAVWFPRGRLTFCYSNGQPAKGNSGGPSAFVSYGDRCDLLLERLRDNFGGTLLVDIIAEPPKALGNLQGFDA